MEETIRKAVRERILKKAVHVVRHISDQDTVVVVLKAVVLVEEGLEKIIRKRLKNPNALIDRRTNLSKKLKVFEALYDEGMQESVCLAIKALAKLRNAYAHELEILLEEKKSDVKALVQNVNRIEWIEVSQSQSLEQQVRDSVLMLCLELDELGADMPWLQSSSSSVD